MFQDVELSEGVIPEDVTEVEISKCRELKIQSGAFNGGKLLKRVRVIEINSLVVNKQAFQNITSPNPFMEIFEINKVTLKRHAFKNTKGPLSIKIHKCNEVTIMPNTFSWLLDLTIKDVPNLTLASNALKLLRTQNGRHGPAPRVNY